uniref:Uncharacterized protein n=1 Tax=Anser brachyrhynchus TaxID=132585 RepID=A0A8B9D0F5_9AVES
MPSTRPVVCPRAKLRSLPWGSPAVGPGTVCAKPRAGDSGDLMDFYATTYAVAYGHPGFRPYLGHRRRRWLRLQHPLRCRRPHLPTQRRRGVRAPAAGQGWGHLLGVPLVTAMLASRRSRFWDTATSTTTERFQPLLLPDGRSLLPQHVHQPGSGYGRQQPLPHLRAGAVSPPPASGEHGADPAQTDVLQRTTIGAKEETGFARATLTSGTILPPALGQPLGASTTTTAYLPPAHRTGGRALPVLARGSDRSSGFSREAPGLLSVPVSGSRPVPCAPPWPHPLSPRRPRPTAPPCCSSPGGCRPPAWPRPACGAGRAAAGGWVRAPDPPVPPVPRGWAPTPRFPPPPQEPSGFTTNHGRAATPPWAPCPAAPGECDRARGADNGRGGPAVTPRPSVSQRSPGPAARRGPGGASRPCGPAASAPTTCARGWGAAAAPASRRPPHKQAAEGGVKARVPRG